MKIDNRLFHFIKKEFIQLSRDPRMLFIALAMPIIQLIIFGYVASTDIIHVKTAILDHDKTYYSRTYLDGFQNSKYFEFKYVAKDVKQIITLMDRGEVQIGIQIPAGFGKKVIRGETADVQAIIDGTNSSSATIISGYINQINFNFNQAIMQNKLQQMGLSPKALNLVDLRLRVWYNPELKSINFMVPAIFASLLMIVSMILTSTSIVKEKEKGTIEMLSVTPLKPYELILGKLLPFAMVAIFDFFLVLAIATLWFKVPLKGSIFLLFMLTLVFILTGLGLGVFLSTMARTLRQAIMGSTLVLIPSFIISGFIFPIENMPPLIQYITYLIPLKYFLIIIRGIFLKGNGIEHLWNNALPLALFGVIILSLSILRFRKKLE